MNYWSNVTELYNKQRAKGIATYGQTLEENNKLSIIDSLVMAQEELVDLLVYLEKLKELLTVRCDMCGKDIEEVEREDGLPSYVDFRLSSGKKIEVCANCIKEIGEKHGWGRNK